MPPELSLRAVISTDLPVFFEYQLDEEANFMAAFTAKDPTDRDAFMAHWQRILADKPVIIQTLLADGEVAGSILSYEDEGKPEVSHWLGKRYWGQGIATWALKEFLAQQNPARPMYARVAKDNFASRQVLEKCGFRVIEQMIGYANAQGAEIAELLLVLDA
jgi:RimJ/RimL family protein N-acetyltransferase